MESDNIVMLTSVTTKIKYYYYCQLFVHEINFASKFNLIFFTFEIQFVINFG